MHHSFTTPLISILGVRELSAHKDQLQLQLLVLAEPLLEMELPIKKLIPGLRVCRRQWRREDQNLEYHTYFQCDGGGEVGIQFT